jgi:MoaA/NifB/PqqE/SkfB family radical SAM enzyme
MRFIILLTKNCNLFCDHCFFGQDEGISSFTIKGIKDVFNELDKVKCNYIAISGGEPFLYWDLLTKTVQLAGNKKVNCSINTNGYWASESKVNDKIKLIKELGLSRLKFSTDHFHQIYVSFDTLSKAIDIALKESIDVDITICYSNKYNEYKTVGLLQKRFKDKIKIRFQKIGHYGRAIKNIPINQFNSSLPKNKWFCNEIDSPTIMHNGDVYACCGPPVSNRLFPINNDNPFFLGNLFTSDLESILRKHKETNWIQAMLNSESNCHIKQKIFSNSGGTCICDYCIQYAQSM